ncbi:MAG: hypothetical protein VKK04_25560 [Synechococcales bacterium]|nr:hypothetical protein [Synechococcales bacterium]
MSQQKKRMGGMKLGDFGNTETPTESAPEDPPNVLEDELVKPLEPKPSRGKSGAKKPKQEKLVTVNIKITKSQQDWLRDTAQQVRDNNEEPQPAADRVYPQHLIGVAIALLQSADIDWDEIRDANELKKRLNL